MKNGKKPISSQQQPSFVARDDVFGSALTIPLDLQQELAGKGLVGRWINATELAKFQGYHPKGWTPYKRQSGANQSEFKFGNDPDGIIRRGDCILAVKKDEDVAKHRQYLQQAADRQNKSVKGHANELRQTIKEHGVKSSVVEGYDDNDE